jgi:hypothetical protein
MICPNCKSDQLIGFTVADSDVHAIYRPQRLIPLLRKCHSGCGKTCVECPGCKSLTVKDICEHCNFDFENLYKDNDILEGLFSKHWLGLEDEHLEESNDGK